MRVHRRFVGFGRLGRLGAPSAFGAFTLVVSTLVGCGPRVGKPELQHAADVLGCPSVGSGTRRHDAEVQAIRGCGKVMYFRRNCGPHNAHCVLKSDAHALAELVVTTLPCDRGVRVEHVAVSDYRVSGCGRVVEYTSDEHGFRVKTTPNRGAQSPAAPATVLGRPIPPSRRPIPPEAVFARSYQSTFVVLAGERQGTGFAISTDGLTVTNLHVVAGAPEIRARFIDGYEGRALHVEAYDEQRDLALIRINRNLNALPLGEPDRLSIGEPIVTIGNPLGLQATISEGIVSGVRVVKDGTEFVQTTAPISPGSSGGPVFNQYGEVIAVSTFVLRGGANLGFGVPAKYVRELIGRRRLIPLAEFAQATQAEDGKGCSDEDRRLIADRIASALEAGGALEKSGSWLAARQLYEGAVVDISSSLSESCRKPRDVLEEAREDAKRLSSDRERTLALRHALERLPMPGAD